LDSVIVRIDLAGPNTSLIHKIPPTVVKAAQEKFPIAEPRRSFEGELKVDPFGHKISGGNISEGVNWIYHGAKREKTLTLSPEAVFIVYKDYSSFTSLRDDFLSVVQPYFEHFNIPAMRFGLRYINHIQLAGSPFDWGDYFSDHILRSLDCIRLKEEAAKLWCEVAYNHDDMFLHFRFGLSNPDYPAKIYKRRFSLDFDAFVQGQQDYAAVEANLDRAHDLIQLEFESSITDDLRELMKAE